MADEKQGEKERETRSWLSLSIVYAGFPRGRVVAVTAQRHVCQRPPARLSLAGCGGWLGELLDSRATACAHGWWPSPKAAAVAAAAPVFPREEQTAPSLVRVNLRR